MSKLLQPWQTLPSPFSLLALTIAALCVETATGQCATQWLPGPAFAGTDSPVYAIAEWDPDGAGPHGSLIVAGGLFLAAGSVAANRVAAYDPSTLTWRNLGGGMNDVVLALAVLPSGDLVAAGRFTLADGTPASRIARWDGTSWLPLGAGVSGDVRALAVLPNGDLVVAGLFTSAGGTPANRIARWNGIAWAPLGSGLAGTVLSLAVLPNGHLVAGGVFTMAGGLPANRVALWNGATWSPIGSFAAASSVNSVLAMPNGDVIVGGGSFGGPSSSSARVWRWDGTTWSTLGSFGWISVSALALLPNGDIAAGTQSGLMQWNGTTWVGIGTAWVYGLTTLANGNLVASGGFGSMNGVRVDGIAIWDGTNWSPAGPNQAGPSSTSAVTALPNGDVVTVAEFWFSGVLVVRWTGTNWTSLGGSFDNIIAATALLTNGDLVVGGYFGNVGGTPMSYIARWDGTNWLPLGSGVDSNVLALAALPNGDLVAAGDFQSAGGSPANRVARWNGTTWSALANGLGGSVKTLAVLPNGDIVAGGELGGVANVARWDGTSWTPLGTMVGGVYTLAVLPTGEIVAGGQLTQASGVAVRNIARWNGVSWSPLGAGLGLPPTPLDRIVTSLVVLPNGDLVACGRFDRAGGVPTHGIARWDGANWFPLATSEAASAGTGLPTGPLTMGLLANGDLAVGGTVSIMNGVVAARIARLTTTCPASATASAAGCSGSGGLNVLTAQTLPWVGSTYRANATGMPANALALGAYGATTTSIPLPVILPQGAPGCSLLVSPDHLDLVLPSGGAAQTQLAIPNTVSIAGLVLHQQVVAFDLGTTGSIVSVTSTNRVTLTIGFF